MIRILRFLPSLKSLGPCSLLVQDLWNGLDSVFPFTINVLFLFFFIIIIILRVILYLFIVKVRAFVPILTSAEIYEFFIFWVFLT